MNGISIIICCYNSASRLEKTIQHIALQKQVSFSFEVVLVDNNSTDKTSVIAKELFLRYNIANYQIVFESTTGLIYARKCGVLNAKHDILVFCISDGLFSLFPRGFGYFESTDLVKNDAMSYGGTGSPKELVNLGVIMFSVLIYFIAKKVPKVVPQDLRLFNFVWFSTIAFISFGAGFFNLFAWTILASLFNWRKNYV